MTLAAQIETLFAEFDAAFTARQIEWAKGRKAALSALLASEEYAELGKISQADRDHAVRYNGGRYVREAGSTRQRERREHVAGGKGWLEVFTGRNWPMIELEVIKNCQRTAEARNARILAKLEKAGASRAEALENAIGTGGINGWFLIATDAGTRRVTIETILAGGYNVQCLHARVLVKISK